VSKAARCHVHHCAYTQRVEDLDGRTELTIIVGFLASLAVGESKCIAKASASRKNASQKRSFMCSSIMQFCKDSIAHYVNIYNLIQNSLISASLSASR
jgi:hypothetical protein